MANYYVRSGAGGAGTGADWANAYTTLTLALAGKTNADVLWVANDHSESTVGAVTLTCPTSWGLQILGVNTNVTEPPTALVSGTPTAIVAVGASSNRLRIDGFAYINGIIFQGSTNNATSCTIEIGETAVPHVQVYENCHFQLRTANGTPFIGFSQMGTGSNDDVFFRLINCTFKFSATSHNIIIGKTPIIFENVTIDATGSTPTTLFEFDNTHCGTFRCDSSDLSTPAWTNLVNVVDTTSARAIFRYCKLPAGVNITTGAFPSAGGSQVFVHDCDSADTQIRIAEHMAQGSIVSQVTTRIRTGGATQKNGTAYSLLMTGTAFAENLFTPLRSMEIAKFQNDTGSAKTVTVEILRDSVTNLQNDEVWLEVQYLSVSGFPKGSILTDRMTDVFATPADQTTSSVAWDTTGMANPNKQKLEVTFTPQEAGYIFVKVCLAKNTSIYVDPLITVS